MNLGRIVTLLAIVGLATYIGLRAWARWPVDHPKIEDPSGIAWLALVALSFLVAYRSTRGIFPRSRWEPSAWMKAAVRSFPWAILLTPSMAFGFIAIPAPAGLLAVGWAWQKLSGAPYLQGPHNASGPIACIAISFSWFAISLAALFAMRLQKMPNKAPEPTPTSVTSPAAQEPRQP